MDVTLNLLVNAIEVLKTGGEVRVAACRDGDMVLIDVIDSGPGVPTAVRSRIFQPFVSEGKKNGLGLGLALSRQTVLNHGGDLWLVHESGGAHFRMRLAG